MSGLVGLSCIGVNSPFVMEDFPHFLSGDDVLLSGKV